ncbi:uncharacterized protein LOC133716288 [Rosa rugosa]|uniref:uncharacterized protein LOC133716288 n=1 Tax=Rosa rugosa TaxID=74645 RepID=UPI002B4138B7|nr:uncharacterized protein LOC133716288 [Rosa rugosa]
MEEFARRFAGALVLLERESRGLRIGGIAARSALQNEFAVVCRVFTEKTFRRRSFMDLSLETLGGAKGVVLSDVEGDRFLARFKCAEDMQRVLNREPWDFDRSLILMAPLGGAGSVMDVALSSTVMWVQAHGVPWRFCTPEVAEAIGGMVGTYERVKTDEQGCCVGKFLCIKVRMDVSLALLRHTVVDFPGVGDQLVEFKYERLPEFYQECGLIGHPTRECDEKLGTKNKRDSERPFATTLKAKKDLFGRWLDPHVGRTRMDGAYSGGESSDIGSGSQS